MKNWMGYEKTTGLVFVPILYVCHHFQVWHVEDTLVGMIARKPTESRDVTSR